ASRKHFSRYLWSFSALGSATENALPFMKTLKSCTSGKMVQWTTEANEAFQRMKECLESLPTMVIPTKGETLTLYLAALKRNVSAVLMAKRGKKQAPVYFQVLAKLEKSRHVAKWAIKLGEHEIEFKGRNSIKGQILAEFLAKTSSIEREEEKDRGAKRKEPEPENTWKLFIDGASSSDGSGAVLMLLNPKGKEYTYALRFEFETTNNEAEYEALIAGLRIAK
nr:reverse transcriptase domain-containing protein [Tanacetum cinerariifolium]